VASLRPEQCCGYDGDTVGPPVGGLSGCDDDRVCQVLAELVAEPEEMTQVSLFGSLAELDLDRHGALSALDDEVDLAVAAPRAQVERTRLSGLGVDADAKRDQRLEERSEQCPFASDWRAGRLGVQQG
jgi:hypothetical protein